MSFIICFPNPIDPKHDHFQRVVMLKISTFLFFALSLENPSLPCPLLAIWTGRISNV